MATSITYKGSELVSFNNTTKTLKTAGKYLEGDITVTTTTDVNNQSKTFTPSETSTTITFDNNYTGLSQVTVAGITPTYIGSNVNFITYYTGSSAPTAGLGANGDIYLQTV